MAKKTLGHVKLEWACPRCATRNPGPQKFCNGCGGPQPAEVQFTQAPEEKLLTDPAEIALAKAGPDIHCPFCAARNAGTAKFCGACGGKLEGGQVRQAGQIVGALRTGPASPVRCPSCGTENPGTAQRCGNCGAALTAEAAQKVEASAKAAAPAPPACRSRALLLGLGALILIGCLIVGLFLMRGGGTQTASAVVQDVYWSRSVAVETLGLVEAEDWYENIPGGAQLGDCRNEYRGTSDQPVANSVEVCGTPYTVDTGGGYGEVVQDCVYEVYDDWCEYLVEDWQVVDTLSASGYDLNPYWPSASLAGGQRQGQAEEQFTVVFATDDGRYEYQAQDADEFSMFAIGSTWEIEVDGSGNLTSISPAP